MIGKPLYLAIALSGLLVLSGCLEEDGDSACIIDGELEAAPILITVGCGDPRSQPTYLWVDAGSETIEGVTVIEVTRTSDPDVAVWRVIDGSLQENIVQPVDHGVSPPDSIVEVPDETELEFNIEYEVKMTRISGGAGTKKFIVLPEE